MNHGITETEGEGSDDGFKGDPILARRPVSSFQFSGRIAGWWAGRIGGRAGVVFSCEFSAKCEVTGRLTGTILNRTKAIAFDGFCHLIEQFAYVGYHTHQVTAIALAVAIELEALINLQSCSIRIPRSSWVSESF